MRGSLSTFQFHAVGWLREYTYGVTLICQGQGTDLFGVISVYTVLPWY